VFVNSGSSANLIALETLGITHGHEVITAALSFATVVAPIIQVGATPVFVDVEPQRFVCSVDAVMKHVNERTRMILLPNLIGSKPDWALLKQRLAQIGREDVILMEDSCDTVTFTAESDVSTTSFYASHVITTGGGGGMAMFNDEAHRRRALMFRDWGRVGNNLEDPSIRFEHSIDGIEYDFKFIYGVRGYNFKSCEMNAAFGLAQWDKLPSFLQSRRNNIQRYMENLRGVSPNVLTLPLESERYDWLAMPMMSPHRAKLLRCLEENGIQTRVCFAGNITRHPAYRSLFQEFPEADRMMREGFLLGAHHGLSTEDIDRVCANILKFIQLQ